MRVINWAAAAAVSTLLALAAAPVEARIVRLEILRTEPAFGGQSFGAVGPYQRVLLHADADADALVAPALRDGVRTGR